MIRSVFFGTPESAIPVLHALFDVTSIEAVITQPDQPKGRSGAPVASPVKQAALGLGLAVRQPGNPAQVANVLSDLEAIDVGIVVAYGRILPAEVLQHPAQGLLNVHFSLLPRWRGAAPVARALISGDAMTGVTIIRLDQGLDTGPVLTAQAVDIGPDEDRGTLTGRLAAVGARLLVTCLGPYVRGDLATFPQSDQGLTYATKLTPADRPLTPKMNTVEVVNRVRGLAPVPGALLEVDDVEHKILATRFADAPVEAGSWALVDGRVVAGFADGSVEILAIQPAGRTVMSGADWARGRRRESGVISGPAPE